MDATWEEKIPGFQLGSRDPCGQTLARALRELELNGLLSFLLHDNLSGTHSTAIRHVTQSKLDQVAAPELTVDG